MDDASPDGTQEVAKELAGLYGEDKIVSSHLFCVLGWQVVNVAPSIADSQTKSRKTWTRVRTHRDLGEREKY